MHKVEEMLPIASGTMTDYGASFNQFIYEAIPPATRCLDVGCSAGNLGSALQSSKGCEVDGIEFNQAAAAAAIAKGYRNVFTLDLNTGPLSLPAKKYEVIICGDILEHLISPEKVLSWLAGFLEPNGMVVASLPNVAFLLNRLQLLLGNWNYKQYGILDQTHLRFYTIKTGCKMIESAGLEVINVKPYNQFGALRYISPLDKWFPSIFAYQFLVIAKPSS